MRRWPSLPGLTVRIRVVLMRLHMHAFSPHAAVLTPFVVLRARIRIMEIDGENRIPSNRKNIGRLARTFVWITRRESQGCEEQAWREGWDVARNFGRRTNGIRALREFCHFEARNEMTLAYAQFAMNYACNTPKSNGVGCFRAIFVRARKRLAVKYRLNKNYISSFANSLRNYQWKVALKFL